MRGPRRRFGLLALLDKKTTSKQPRGLWLLALTLIPQAVSGQTTPSGQTLPRQTATSQPIVTNKGLQAPQSPSDDAPQPATQQSTQPETPQPETPQPETPQPETPQPETPQPGASDSKAGAQLAAKTITQQELRKIVFWLAGDALEGRDNGSRGARAAGGFLRSELERMQLRPAGGGRSYFQGFDGISRNVLGLLPGTDPQLSKEVILVGGHYDHVGYGTPQNSFGPVGRIHNGADDNASGIASMLEVIEALQSLPPEERPKRSILFAFWDAEEDGLLGSQHWANQPTLDLSRLRLAVNLDMVGRLNGSLYVYGTRTAAGLRRLVAEENRVTDVPLDFTWEMKDDSDHWTFYQRNIPSVMFHTGLHDDYHRPSDDAEKINYPGLEKVTRLIAGVVLQAANQPQMAPFRSVARQETPEVALQRASAPPALPPRLGVSWQSDQPPAVGLVGLTLVSVRPGTPAALAGLQPGDRLLQFNGQVVHDGSKLHSLVLASPVEATLQIQRASQEQPQQLAVQLAGQPIRVGLSTYLDPAEPGVGIVRRVISHSPAALAGLKRQDRILAVNGRTFSSSAELADHLTRLPGPLQLDVERNGQLRIATVQVPPPPGDPKPIQPNPDESNSGRTSTRQQ